jgi:ABC-2 type transport system permease protein
MHVRGLSHFMDCVGAVFIRDMRIALTHPLGLVSRFANALVGIYGLYCLSSLFDPTGHLGREHAIAFSYFSYTAVNVAFMLLQGTALQVFSSALRADQVNGSLEPILQTQAYALPYVLAAGLWPLLLSFVQVLATLAFASVFLGLDVHHINVATLCCFIALSTFVMTAISIFSAAAVLRFQQVPPSAYLISGAAPVLAGVMFPVSRLPHPLQIVSWLLPLTHSLRGLRGAFQGATIAELWPDAAWLLCVGIVILPIAIAALEIITRRSRDDGTLSHM